MAAEMTIEMTKPFASRAPIHARLRYAVEASTILILLGPSGSGKTTLLRSVAGLEWAGRRENPVPVEDLARYKVGDEGLSARSTHRVHAR